MNSLTHSLKILENIENELNDVLTEMDGIDMGHEFDKFIRYAIMRTIDAQLSILDVLEKDKIARKEEQKSQIVDGTQSAGAGASSQSREQFADRYPGGVVPLSSGDSQPPFQI